MAVAIYQAFPIRELRELKENERSLPGSPDFAFMNSKFAVFVDGCYWHSCPRHGSMPKTNRRFWREKFEKNRERDARNGRDLKELGWVVLRIWECRVKQDPLKMAWWVRGKMWERKKRVYRPRIVRLRPA